MMWQQRPVKAEPWTNVTLPSFLNCTLAEDKSNHQGGMQVTMLLFHTTVENVVPKGIAGLMLTAETVVSCIESKVDVAEAVESQKRHCRSCC